MITYIILILFINFCTILSNKKTYHYFFVGTICCLIDYFFRTTVPDYDLAVYASLMDNDSYAFYFLKEPFSFLSMRYLYYFFPDPNTVFFLIDVIIIIGASIVLKVARFPIYGVPLILFNFVMMFGHQNIFRQYIAMVIVSLIVIVLSQRSKFLLAIISIGAHNPSLIAILGLFRQRQWFFNIFLAVLGGLGIILGSEIESLSTTETSNNLIFSLLIIIFLIFTSIKKRNLASLIPVYFITIIIISNIYLVSGTSERIFMYLYAALLPLVITQSERIFKPKIFGRVAIANLSLIPFFFTSATKLIV